MQIKIHLLAISAGIFSTQHVFTEFPKARSLEKNQAMLPGQMDYILKLRFFKECV